MDRLTLQIIKDLLLSNGLSPLGIIASKNVEPLKSITDAVFLVGDGTIPYNISYAIVFVEKDFLTESSIEQKIKSLQERCNFFLINGKLNSPLCVNNFPIKEWVSVDLTVDEPLLLFIKRNGSHSSVKLSNIYGKRFKWQRTINLQNEEPLKLVTLMDFPDDEKYNLLCMVWLKYARNNAPYAPIVIFTSKGLNKAIEKYCERFENIEVRHALIKPIKHFDHYNLAVKLYNLANLDFPFLFFDADAILLSDPSYLWERRHYKPWIGVDDQTSELRLCAPFSHLNSGMQLVSDPAFYNYDLIIKRFEAGGLNFICNGEDQALLFDYFRVLGFDYRHPEINAGWNCCSRYCRLYKDEKGLWRGTTRNFPQKYDVHIVHYWNGSCRPWNLKCPLYFEELEIFKKNGIPLKMDRSISMNVNGVQRKEVNGNNKIKLQLLNAKVDILQNAGHSPFYPLRETELELVDSSEDADLIYWYMDIEDPKLDYRNLVYSNSSLFKKYQDKFLLFVPSRTVGILYLNNSISLTPYPIYDRATNALSNVFAIPYVLDCVDIELVFDIEFIEECRNMQKTFDLCYPKTIATLVASGVSKNSQLKFCELKILRKELKVIKKDVRIKIMREVFKMIASSAFYLHYHNDNESPLLLYIAMLLGTVPIVIGLNDLPFSLEVDWRSFSVFPQGNIPLDMLLAAEREQYANKRVAAINFGNTYCALPAGNDRILELIRKPLKR